MADGAHRTDSTSGDERTGSVGAEGGPADSGLADQALRLALDMSPVGMAVLDLDGRLLAANPALCEMLGRSEAELTGLTASEVTHPDDVDEDLAYGAAVIAGRVDQPPLEKRFVRPDGGIVWGLLTARLIRDAAGEPAQLFGQVVDITVQRHADPETRAIAEHHTAALQSITDAVYSLDHEWRFTYVNRRAEQLLRQPRHVLLGHDFWEAFSSTRGSVVEEAYRSAMTERVTQHVDAYFCTPLEVWLEEHIYPSTHGVTVYLRDISDRVEREQAQARLLEAEREAADRLRQLDRMKNAFLSAVSHELRTPLSVVQGAAATLQQRRRQLDDESRARLEDALVEHATRLGKMLEDLLDVDRLTRSDGGARRERFDLGALVAEVVATSHVADRTKVTGPASISVDADPVQVERILANLLDNAAKYAPDGAVEIRVTALGGGGARIEVLDDGPGIPDDDQTRVFEPFHRLEETTPTPGTGIGLALVSEFARIHGGRAWVQRRDTGAHLVVELPGPSQPHAVVLTDD